MSTQAPHRPLHTTDTPTGATPTNSTPTSTATPLVARDYKWRTWQDWCNLVLGVFLAVTPTFLSGISVGWAVTMGVVVAVIALWALATSASQTSEWFQVAAGVVTFIAPWIAGFAAGAAGWITWVLGVVVVGLALWSMFQYKADRS